MPSRLALAALIGVFSQCSDPTFTGDIDADSVERLRQEAVEGATISLTSLGGNPVHGRSFGEIVRERDLSIRLGDECSSSCAEFVLPAATRIVAGPDTLIGYHANDWIGDWLRNTQYPDLPPNCGAERLTYLRDVYAEHDLNPQAWREVARRLMIVNVETEVRGQCTWGSLSAWTSIWFPTSAQMRDIFGYRDIEALCSDDEACWVPRLQSFGGPGTRYAVGDRFVRLTNDGRIVDFDPADLGDEFLVPDAAYAVEQ